MLQRPIILIGGAPTTGKSTMAALIAKHLDIPWIPTDQISQILRTVANRNDLPKLFFREGYSAERYLTEFSAEQIVQMEMDSAEIAWPAVRMLIEEDYTWKNGFVVEGDNILPRFITQDFSNSQHVKPVFLFDGDTDRMRDVIFKRGLWSATSSYPDEVKEKELEWVTLFSRKLKLEVEKYNYPLVEIQKNDNDLSVVLKALNI